MKNDYVPHKYVRMETKPLSHSTLRNVQQRIVAVFNKAVKTGKLNTNPFYQLEKCDTFAKVKATDRKSLTPDELEAFMSSAETSPGVAETQKAFGFACLTGLRISEFCGLTVKDLDFDEEVINVDHQLQRSRSMKYYIESTKTTSGTRKIPMTEEVKELCQKL